VAVAVVGPVTAVPVAVEDTLRLTVTTSVFLLRFLLLLELAAPAQTDQALISGLRGRRLVSRSLLMVSSLLVVVVDQTLVEVEVQLVVVALAFRPILRLGSCSA
jgi:hypothetical protein